MQLLNCLKVLLNEDTGGLKGPPEAMQISRLMAKFSKKIVSKSLYVFILKESTPHLLNIFMDAGGWNLIYNWLKDAVETDNIVLIQDLLTIFHIVPVTMERLKANGGPKLVKKLSKTHIDTEVKSLAQQLVEKWLKVVKTEQWHSMMSDKESLTKHETLDNLKSETGGHLILNVPKIDSGVSSEPMSETSDCKTKIDKSKNKCENEKVKDKTKKDKINLNIKTELDKNKEKPKLEKVKDDSDDAKEKKRRIKDKNGNPFLRIIGEMTDEKCDEDKQIENDNSNSTKHSSRRKQNLKNLSSGEKIIKLKLSNDSKKSSDSNSSSDLKKETRPLPPPAPKPKLPESKTILEKKNYSIHVEKKDYVGEKKPTVKTFKSKFRSTGLEEQAPPPPHPKSKVQSKKSTKTLSPLPSSKAEKRSLSPPSDSQSEKKLKSSSSDIKKLPPKIKESGLFMDAMLNVLNSAPKVTKKRKPKPDVVKKNSPPPAIPLSPVKSDLPSPSRSPVHSPSTLDLDSLVLSEPLTSANESPSFSESITPSDYVPLSTENNTSDDVIPDPEPELNVEPIVEKPPQLKFYRDTLLDSTNESLNTDEPEEKVQAKSPIDESTTNNCNDKKSGMRSVLVYVRNKSSKKSVSWKQESDLVKVSYFEHDETERVNVTKNFKAMEMHERDIERQNFIAVRKLNAADNMESKTPWRYLDNSLLVDIPEEPGKEKIEPGSGSQEKKKQTLREQSVLQAIYFTRNMIPDSPEEPDQMEIMVPYSEPLNIPLEDMSGDTAPIYNYVNISWPESKGDQPPVVEFPIGMNNMMSMPNMMIPQPQFQPQVFGGNQMNWGMPPENMMGMGPPANNMYIPPNQMMMNNQMFMGDQMQQQPQPLSLQQQPPPPLQQQQQHQQQQQQQQHQNHPPPVQEDQWMGPPGPPMQHDHHWGQQQPPPNNGPPHFERGGGGGGRGHTRWDNPRGGNYDSYRGKMNRNNQRGNRGGPYNRRGGHPGNGRVGGRLCKYYAKQGFCKTTNCAFLHSKC
ncbi:serine/threonine-protein phosphatase 1 regulatory subunit 10 isoform X2 [Aphis gossypii]|nr:serine/threonine-protein phosphatase 1 regulatory subunit 10 isoform X2 [Aphis gossypii]CAH1736219.1 unnamed protein product [Aphis gossypii]